MTKILFIINNLGPGGAERQLIELIKGISANFECHLIVLDMKKINYIEDAQRYCKQVSLAERKSRFDLSPIFFIARYCREHKIDVVQSFLPLASFYAAMASRWATCPLICCAIRDGKDHTWQKRVLIQLLSRLATKMIANSEAGLRNRFATIRSNMQVIYNGLDLQRFQEIQKHSRPLAKQINIAMAASFSDHKDHITLIKAFAQLQKKFDLQLYLYGEGVTQANIKTMVKQYKLSDSVFFQGFRKDVLQQLAKADIGVLISNSDVHEEGISNTVIECMAIGLPVVASNGGGTGEIIDDGKTGFLIENKDVPRLVSVLTKLIEDDGLRKAIGIAGQQRVNDKFLYQKFLDSYMALYQQLAKGEQ